MSALTGNILITGGSGTLGHAIVRTAEQEGWACQITIYSRSELRQAQMRARHPGCRYILGDVRDADRLMAAIAGHDIVIHAAAMKRIPECEQHPAECYATNVIGSMNVLRACQLQGVARLIGISTDKACRAITAYGASKLAMEKLLQSAPETPTICTLVRYGNVVASNGSVIPYWREQAAHGRPLLITDPAMTRFWMAPSEAVALITHAAAMQGGTITIPKMHSLSLSELAAIIAPESEQLTIGLRSVEKQHEDLVHTDEQATSTFSHIILSDVGSEQIAYTSYNAPRLTREAFLSMLEEAESYE